MVAGANGNRSPDGWDNNADTSTSQNRIVSFSFSFSFRGGWIPSLARVSIAFVLSLTNLFAEGSGSEVLLGRSIGMSAVLVRTGRY